MRAVPPLLRFGSKMVRLTEEKPGSSWVGSTGEPGVLLVLRADGGLFTASLEDRDLGDSFTGKPKLSPSAAAANLLRKTKRLCRASGLRAL